MAERKLGLGFLVWYLISPITVNGQDILPKEAEAVKNYILKQDYLELFGNKPYHVKIENMLITDVDGDGNAEVVVHLKPHYRQSPPIIIYRLSSDLKVSRVKEGLAPGPLVPLTGEYLDSHELGLAVDFEVKEKQDVLIDRKKIVKVALENFGGVVEYKNFLHADNRDGDGSYIDMTRVETQPDSKNCGQFEFSKVTQISAGTVSGRGDGNYLAALVDDHVYLYKIEGFIDNEFIIKKFSIHGLPNDFKSFATKGGAKLGYSTNHDEIKDFNFTDK